jgi:hypothetical protein
VDGGAMSTTAIQALQANVALTELEHRWLCRFVDTLAAPEDCADPIPEAVELLDELYAKKRSDAGGAFLPSYGFATVAFDESVFHAETVHLRGAPLSHTVHFYWSDVIDDHGIEQPELVARVLHRFLVKWRSPALLGDDAYRTVVKVSWTTVSDGDIAAGIYAVTIAGICDAELVTLEQVATNEALTLADTLRQTNQHELPLDGSVIMR